MGAVQRSFAWASGIPLARLAAVQAAESAAASGPVGDEPADAASGEPNAAEVAPEIAADLDELGARLPGTGSRVARGEQDTDEDLF